MPENPLTPVIHIIHENPDWLPPLRSALDAAGVPFRELSLESGSIDLGAEPPEGVFWSRLSASAHTREHPAAKEYARAVFRWLESHGRRVINGSRAAELEVSKVAQYTALAAAGFDVPRTIALFGTEDASERARELAPPFITKHNQGGKGLGVRRFDANDSFDRYLRDPDFEEPVDGITLLQEYVRTAEPFVTRAEFVGGRLVYAVRVDTSAGSFELCPAEACAVPGTEAPPLFSVREDVTADDPFIERLGGFLVGAGIEIAGVEFFETADGRRIPYDINTNTNYSPDVEAETAVGGVGAGVRAAAAFLAEELRSRYAAAVA